MAKLSAVAVLPGHEAAARALIVGADVMIGHFTDQTLWIGGACDVFGCVSASANTALAALAAGGHVNAPFSIDATGAWGGS